VSTGPTAAGRKAPPTFGVKPGPLAVPTRCGWCSAHSRAPKILADRDDFHRYW